MFSWVISDFQHPQVSALDTESYTVQFGDVRILLTESPHKTLHLVIMVVMEFLWFYEIDFFSVGIILDFVDMLNQALQSVWLLWHTGTCGCGDHRGSRGFLGDRIGQLGFFNTSSRSGLYTEWKKKIIFKNFMNFSKNYVRIYSEITVIVPTIKLILKFLSWWTQNLRVPYSAKANRTLFFNIYMSSIEFFECSVINLVSMFFTWGLSGIRIS